MLGVQKAGHLAGKEDESEDRLNKEPLDMGEGA
jgi:hypothetical protein